jgi:subtilisin family serine protease
VGEGIPGTDDGQFRAESDWLYNDANANSRRDYGRADGFGEANPTYGERLFIADDPNGNGLLDIGESLFALGSGKVLRVLGPAGMEYVRGINLMDCPLDTEDAGHGTQVCSVVAGGRAGMRRYTGAAPDASLLVADRYNNDYAVYVPWAESNGAQVMLYEFGSWVQEFLDGSSNLEQMLDAESAKGIVQVVPAGNLAGSGKHAQVILPARESRSIRFSVPSGGAIEEAWLTVLWRAAEAAVTVALRTPTGATTPLAGDSSWLQLEGQRIWSAMDRSSRGTVRLDVFIQRAAIGLTQGEWALDLSNQTPGWLSVHGYAYDPGSEWAGGVRFLDHVDSLYTVASPATADSAIAVASYSVRGRAADPPGALSFFSGQGPRLDGAAILDVAAPGHYDIACARSKAAPGGVFGQYGWFGGTSAAAAHVAGAAALLVQSNLRLHPDQITQMLHQGALQDSQTGIVPNDRWGWGKLDVLRALAWMPTPSPTPRARVLLPILLRASGTQ